MLSFTVDRKFLTTWFVVLLVFVVGIVVGLFASQQKSANLPLFGLFSHSLTPVAPTAANNTHIISKTERNNTVEQATPLVPGYETQATLVSEDDVDFYNFTLDNAARVKIDLRNLPEKFDLYLYDQNHKLIASSFRYGIDEAVTLITLPSTGKYYIKVGSSYKSGANFPYTIRLSILPFYD